MNSRKLQSAISAFVKNKKANAAYYDDNWTERRERKTYYQSFTRDKLLAMTEEDFFEYISRLWSMVIWGNKKYVVDKLIADNGFDTLKKRLAELLYGIAPIDTRWTAFLQTVKGLGPATISELLTYTNPEEYVIFNKTTILVFIVKKGGTFHPALIIEIWRRRACTERTPFREVVFCHHLAMYLFIVPASP